MQTESVSFIENSHGVDVVNVNLAKQIEWSISSGQRTKIHTRTHNQIHVVTRCMCMNWKVSLHVSWHSRTQMLWRVDGQNGFGMQVKPCVFVAMGSVCENGNDRCYLKMMPPQMQLIRIILQTQANIGR